MDTLQQEPHIADEDSNYEINEDDLHIELNDEHGNSSSNNQPYNWDEEFSNKQIERDQSASDISKEFRQLEQIKLTSTTTATSSPTRSSANNTTTTTTTITTINNDDDNNPKANLLSTTSTTSKQQLANDSEVIQVEEDEDKAAYEQVKKQWDDVQQLREQQQYGKVSNQISDSSNTRELNISYDETIKYFSGCKLNHELEVAREKLNQSSSNSLFGKLFSCFNSGSSSSSSSNKSNSTDSKIRKEKEFLVALTLIPLNHEIEQHERQLYTIYKKITGDVHNCPSIGPHWESIGFQGSDPKTDLRGVGMLGLVQLLFFVYSDERTTRDLYSLSQTQSFPMAVVSLNITQMILKMLIDNKLKSLIKRYGNSVTDAVNIAYSSVFYRFYLVWKRGQKRIIDFDAVKKELIVEVNKHLRDIIDEYTGMVLKRENVVTNRDSIEFN